MLKQFYEKMLPSQGVYCVGGLEPGNEAMRQRFTETIDELLKTVDKLKSENLNVYVTPGSFEGYARKTDECLFVRSFFIDLDVRSYDGLPPEKQAKYYPSKDAALEALSEFVEQYDMPPPVRLDSGTGIQAYWLFDRDVPREEWMPHAKHFKSFCQQALKIDPAVTGDAARFMRAPYTFNHKTSPPSPTKLLDAEFVICDFGDFVEHIGSKHQTISAILSAAPKGLDEDTLKLKKLDNFEHVFQDIAEKSLNDEGCNQIKNILVNAATLEYELWTAGLSVASKCVDGDEAIHLMSEDHPKYDRQATIEKAASFGGVHPCSWFQANYSEGCANCAYKDRAKTPLYFGRRLKEEPDTVAISEEDTPDAVRQIPNTKKVPDLPDYLKPFQRGVNGGIYYTPPPKTTKDGKKIQDDPILLYEHDVYPIRRLFTPHDGECMVMKIVLPKDGDREFLFPTSYAYKKEDFTKAMVANGVFFNSHATAQFMNYFEKWGRYLVNTNEADIMRTQMGWTEDHKAFVYGMQEVRSDGSVREAAASPYVRKLAKMIKPTGSYEVWKNAVNKLNIPGMEMLALGLLSGFGSPLMRKTNVSGVSVVFTGGPGNGKTGAMYAGLSVFMDPKNGCVVDATDNGLVGRYLALHSLMYGLDEVSNRDGKELSNLIHKVSSGKAKIKMQGSVNAEREMELSASLVLFMTSNQSVYDKLSGYKGSPEGEVARAIEFMIRKPQPLIDDPGLGAEIFNVLNFNYGWAGPEFIKYYYQIGEDAVLEKVSKWIKRWHVEFGHDSSYRFYDGYIGATFAGGEMAVEAGIIDIDIERVYHRVVNEIILIRENTGRLNDIDYKELISEFVHRNLRGMLVLSGEKVLCEPSNNLMIRIDIADGILYISKTAMREYLAEKQVSTREFEFNLRKERVLVTDKSVKKRLSTGWRAGMHTPAVSVYGFAHMPEDIFDDITKTDGA